MAIFEVYPDGNGKAKEAVDAPTARAAARRYHETRVKAGEAPVNEVERVIVEHADGPAVDPSAKWDKDEDGTFARFDVAIVAITAIAVEAK